MLRELHVRNLAVLAEASVEFGPGLNVLTGETGAGKSIVVDSLALVAGARADQEMIRTGEETLSVAALFLPAGASWRSRLEESGLEADGDELLIRREIARSGRNRVFVNDQPATLRLVADLAADLLRIHGQRDELGLVDPEQQRSWLDASAGPEAQALLAATRSAFDEWSHLAERLERAGGDQRLRAERLDLLRFQASEIDSARPMAGEEESLRGERDVLRNVEAITRALGGAFDLLFEGEEAAVDRAAHAAGMLAEAAAWQPEAAEWAAEVEDSRLRLAEVATSIRRRLDGLEADPARLDQVEARLATLERLFHKYRLTTAAALLERRAQWAAEIEELEGGVADRGELERLAAGALSVYREAALALSAGRAAWGARLAMGIEAELVDLGLGRARLSVALERRPRAGSPLTVGTEAVDFGPEGVDQVVLLFAPNPGEEPRALSLIASGGELSRIYLALQLAVRGRGGEEGPTLIFDEVDTGIGGAQAAALGRKLQRLGGEAQVLVVTHLAQVASFGDHHFRVSKRIEGGRTATAVEALDGPARIDEIARMAGGETLTELSRSHAGELLAAAAAARAAPAPPAARRERKRG